MLEILEIYHSIVSLRMEMCLPVLNTLLTKEAMELAVISDFHHRRSHGGIGLGTFTSYG